MTNMNQLVYGIVGATLADRSSESDAVLSQNAKVRSAILSSLGTSAGPMGSLLIAKLVADETIKAETATAQNAQLTSEKAQLTAQNAQLVSEKAALADIQLQYQTAIASLFDSSGMVIPTASTEIPLKFNSDGTLR